MAFFCGWGFWELCWLLDLIQSLEAQQLQTLVMIMFHFFFFYTHWVCVQYFSCTFHLTSWVYFLLLLLLYCFFSLLSFSWMCVGGENASRQWLYFIISLLFLLYYWRKNFLLRFFCCHCIALYLCNFLCVYLTT